MTTNPYQAPPPGQYPVGPAGAPGVPYAGGPGAHPPATSRRGPGQLVISFGQFGAKLAVVLIALGLLAIGAGYNGAASQLNFVSQFPYLLSGGILGLALVIIGGALLVVQGAREDRARLEAKLDVLTDVLSRSGGLGSGGGVALAPGGPLPENLSGLVAAGSASYHVPGCRLVDGRESVSYLTPAEARARALKPCRVCSPDGADVTDASGVTFR